MVFKVFLENIVFYGLGFLGFRVFWGLSFFGFRVFRV